MQTWQQRTQDKRERLLASIPDDWRIPAALFPAQKVVDVTNFPRSSGLLSPNELKITDSSLNELAGTISDGTWTAVEVTRAFCHRAAIAHQLLNCCIEIFFEVAIERATQLDRYFEQHKKVVGPLHGIPISLKDQLRIDGIETSMGYVAWLGKFEQRESVLTSLLRQAGAVLYVKTNVPQTLMSGETMNNIIGRTISPYNRTLSSGGSSGGEGALLGLRGSILGVGSDIGGSIRIPSAFNNLFGLRPSHGRLPYALAANSMAGQETVHSVLGSMGHNPLDLALFMSSILAQEPWYHDPKVVEIPWREERVKAAMTGSKTFGYIAFDGVVMPHPPIQRAMRESIAALTKAGHRVFPITPYHHDCGFDMITRICSSDGNIDVNKTIAESGEPKVPGLGMVLQEAMTVTELWELQVEKYTYQREYMEYWNKISAENGPMDAIIMPVAPHAGVRHGQFLYCGYTSIVNLLDYAAVTVPIGFSDAKIDLVDPTYVPTSLRDAANWMNYDAEAYHHSPTAIQLVCRRFEEEKVLGLAEQVRQAMI